MRQKTFPKVYIFDRSVLCHLRTRGRSIGRRLLRSAIVLLLLTLLGWSFTDVAIADDHLDAASSNPAPEVIDSLPQTSIALDANTISSEKISQFVRAYWQVLALLGRREAQLHAAETAAESQRLEGEIAAEAIAIIENAGLTQSEYLQLLALANTDFEFGERVATQLQEEMD
jgi:Domain of unknown function (DUF4168)